MWLAATKGLPGKRYGNFWIGRLGQKYIGAHVFSWKLANGRPVDRGQWVLHSCDVMLCVNPRHLFLGSVLDNNRDMAAKDRVQHGSHHWKAKLTEELVGSVMVRISSGEKQIHIARSLGVSSATISMIKHGHIWQRALRGET